MTAVLAEIQWELDGLVFGAGCPLDVSDFAQGGPEIENGDVALPGQDCTAFGSDYHSGRTLTFELFTAADARAAVQALEARWTTPQLRLEPRRVVPLRMRLPGGPPVLVYGRPRRFEVTAASLRRAGRIELLADFRCADSLFYDDSAGERSVSLSLTAPDGAGITWPLHWPLAGAPAGAPAGERQDTAQVGGSAPAWPLIDFRGPVTQPQLTVQDTGLSLRLDATLAPGETVTVDTRPWARTALRQDGASLSGYLRGAALADLQLPVGSTLLHYGRTDLSGQSSCTVRWRDAHNLP